jgi:putative nucleotidyltransferase with HDIG domain
MTLAMDIFKALATSSKLLKHSYMVSILSVILAKKVGITTNRVLLSIGLGGLLHDIGHTRIKKGIMAKNNLSIEDWEEIKDHPHHGLRILDFNNCINTEVRSIILQHHEQFNGRGYPNRLNNNLIFPPAKIVSVADGFCSLVGTSSYGTSNKSPQEAIEVLQSDIGHYDPEYLEIFSNIILKKA